VSGAVAQPNVRIDRFEVRDTVAEEVRAGLRRDPMELPPKLFYDARGSELFDQITALPEYYPTRCERAILNRHAPRVVEGADELVEIGSGTASKTRALLYAMAGAGSLRRYVPFDVDVSVVEACAEELVELYPGLAVHGVVGDFGHDLERVPDGERRLFAFLGGTIGNLHPPEREAFLESVRALMGPEDRLILGTDFVKDRDVLEAAYNDSAGVTAEFNRNILHVMNDQLGAAFEPEEFEHRAVFNEADSRIEMRLRATSPQRVGIEALGLTLELDSGQELLTEISTKFTPAAVASDLRASGLSLDELLTDDDGMFGLAVASCS
jgi:L-histidine N-alpha-methyltransferase